MIIIDTINKHNTLHVCSHCYTIHDKNHGAVCKNCGTPLIASVLDYKHSTNLRLFFDLGTKQPILIAGENNPGAWRLPPNLLKNLPDPLSNMEHCIYHGKLQNAPWSYVFWEDSSITHPNSTETTNNPAVNKQQMGPTHTTKAIALYNAIQTKLPNHLQTDNKLPINKYRDELLQELDAALMSQRSPMKPTEELQWAYEIMYDKAVKLTEHAVYSLPLATPLPLVITDKSDESHTVLFDGAIGYIDPLTFDVISISTRTHELITLPARLGNIAFYKPETKSYHTVQNITEDGKLQDGRNPFWYVRTNWNTGDPYFTIAASTCENPEKEYNLYDALSMTDMISAVSTSIDVLKDACDKNGDNFDTLIIYFHDRTGTKKKIKLGSIDLRHDI